MPIENGSWTDNAVILSLEPKWERLLSEGVKRFEFRRRWPKRPPPYVALIYSSAPVSAIVGLAQISTVHIGDPEWLAELSRGRRGLESEEDLHLYFQGLTQGAALEIRNYVRLTRGIHLPALRELGLSPPQNYAYLQRYPLLLERVRELYWGPAGGAPIHQAEERAEVPVPPHDLDVTCAS